MDFWLEEDVADDQQGGTGKSTQEGPLRCLECGGDDFYHDNATGAEVCCSCFTQSQKRNEVVDAEDIMLMAARKGGNIYSRERKGNKNRRKPLDMWDVSQPLPELLDCLDGMRVILRQSMKILVEDLLRWDDQPDQQKAAHEMAKHLFLSYVQSWGEGAEHYAKIYPELRFSLRDLFLNPRQRNAVYCSTLKKVFERMQQEKNKGDDDDDDENKDDDKNIKEEEDVAWSPDPAPERTTSTTDPISSVHLPNEKSGKDLELEKKNYREMLCLAVSRASGSDRIGQMEAALLMEPTMELIASILWLSVARSGVAAYRIVQWISNGAIPLQNAFATLLSEGSQQKLRAIHLTFRMNRVTTTPILEYYGSLLLIAAGLKSFDSFVTSPGVAPRRMAKRKKLRQLLPMLPIAAVPVVTAQLIADMGLGQTVLDTALSLIRADKRYRGPKLKGVFAGDIRTVDHVAALVMCAVELRDNWRRDFTIQRYANHFSRTDSTAHGSTGEDAFVPWSEDHGQLITNQSFQSYLKYCENNFTRCVKKNTVDVLHESFSTNHAEGSSSLHNNFMFDEEEYTTERVRPCPYSAGVLLPSIHMVTHYQPSVLQARILFLVRPYKDRHSLKEAPFCAFPHLDDHEVLLLEFLAYSTHSKPSKIRDALIDILSFTESKLTFKYRRTQESINVI